MATTRIIPMHINRGRTIAKCLSDRTEYAMNPDKTDSGEYVTAYACDPKTADMEFLLSKRQYRQFTGRTQQSDVIAHQIRQSFKPGEVTPELANKIGYEFAMRFTKGKHAFIVATHTDKAHIHNHIIWNSTALDCQSKFRDFHRSGQAVRKLSDLICMEHQLSVIEHPQPHGDSYNKWLGGNAKPCNRDLLRAAIDNALSKKPQSFEILMAMLMQAGYEISYGKNITFSRAGQKQNIRLKSLGDAYSEDALRAVINGTKTHSPHRKRRTAPKEKRPSLLSAIEAKINSGRGSAYDQKMKVIRLKSMAETLLFIQQHEFRDYADLARFCSDASAKSSAALSQIKAAEKRMAEISVLRTHIINYSKTRDIYVGYRKSGYSKKYLTEHESDIIIHRAAKKAFDELNLKKLPSINSLQKEYAALLTEKKAKYIDYYRLEKEKRDLLVYKANTEKLLQLDEREPPKSIERQQKEK